MITKIFCFSA